MHKKNEKSDFFDVPADRIGSEGLYYNPRSKLILLDGPRGPMLARYFQTTPPDPTRYQFFTMYSSNYLPFRDSFVPNTAKADVTAIAWPILKSADSRGSIYSGAAPTLEANASPTDRDVMLLPPLGPDEMTSSAHQPGLRVSPTALEGYFDGGGMAIDRDGARFYGKLHLRSTINRGVTEESALFSILPKSAVTFWAADYLPSANMLMRIARWVSVTARIAATLREIYRLVETKTRNN